MIFLLSTSKLQSNSNFYSLWTFLIFEILQFYCCWCICLLCQQPNSYPRISLWLFQYCLSSAVAAASSLFLKSSFKIRSSWSEIYSSVNHEIIIFLKFLKLFFPHLFFNRFIFSVYESMNFKSWSFLLTSWANHCYNFRPSFCLTLN